MQMELVVVIDLGWILLFKEMLLDDEVVLSDDLFFYESRTCGKNTGFL